MINRAVLILIYKQPAVDWINNVDPSNDFSITIEELNNDRNVYLIDHGSAQNLEEMLQLNFKMLFEQELFDWHTREDDWPELTLDLFHKWFEVRCHSIVYDLVGGPIVEDGY